MIRILIILAFGLLPYTNLVAQVTLGGEGVDYTNPKKYEIGGIVVTGTEALDANAIVILSGLTVGDQINIPGDEISNAIRKLWDQKLFASIDIRYQRIVGNTIFLEFVVKEQPRLSKYSFKGVSKSEADDLRESINLFREKIVTKNLVYTTDNLVRNYYKDKGYLNVNVDVEQKNDPEYSNHVIMTIRIKKGSKVKIRNIDFVGNKELGDSRLKMAMKDTKEKSVFQPFNGIEQMVPKLAAILWKGDNDSATSLLSEYFSDRVKIKVFKSSKFVQANYDADKLGIIAKYNQKGYRDAKIISDTVYAADKKSVNIEFKLYEGRRYYFRDIRWVGNTIYNSRELSKILAIRKGDVYDPERLEKQLFLNPNGNDVISLYMDDGYLSFQMNPIEVAVENDSIDLEIRMYEGRQYRISKVSVRGNTKTNDHVVLREIRTKPGQLFSRSDIIRSQRELAVLGYFDPEKLDINTSPNPADGTVDLEYIVAERPSDQIELSGGWGGGRIVGTLGVSFSNFSTKNFFKKGAWQPLPAGDGQRLSVRAQSNGAFFQSYNISFTEPWLGGRKPNALSLTAFYSIQSNGQNRRVKDENGDRVDNPLRSSIDILGLSVGLGKRLTWPDDFFYLYQELSYQHYLINQWNSFIFTDGRSNNLFYKFQFSRNSVGSNPNYPQYGSSMNLSLQLTPPYSFFDDRKYSTLADQDKYRWIEYHKWKFTSSWFTTVVDKLVLNTRVGFGVLGLYNRDLGAAPFERFYLGGSGLTGFALDGREIIALRGYDDQSVGQSTGGTIINKYTMELRYPLSLNPQATIYGLTFVEAGNTWDRFEDYNPIGVRRSAGAGVRIFLPMFGLLGLDWGYRFDDIPNRDMQRSQIHFTIGANLGEL